MEGNTGEVSGMIVPYLLWQSLPLIKASLPLKIEPAVNVCYAARVGINAENKPFSHPWLCLVRWRPGAGGVGGELEKAATDCPPKHPSAQRGPKVLKNPNPNQAEP